MEANSIETGIVIITGPESTGKTELTQLLADYYKVQWIPELSRTYVENLNRPYTYNDVLEIAKQQIKQFESVIESKPKLVFFDTGLLITKVWLDVVYHKCPEWLLEAIDNLPKCLHLLCDIDLPWEPDSVRENGGEMRAKLSEIYKSEFVNYNVPYRIVKGVGEQRLKNALSILNEFKIY